jgi:hypothetical protein
MAKKKNALFPFHRTGFLDFKIKAYSTGKIIEYKQTLSLGS